MNEKEVKWVDAGVYTIECDDGNTVQIPVLTNGATEKIAWSKREEYDKLIKRSSSGLLPYQVLLLFLMTKSYDIEDISAVDYYNDKIEEEFREQYLISDIQAEKEFLCENGYMVPSEENHLYETTEKGQNELETPENDYIIWKEMYNLVTPLDILGMHKELCPKSGAYASFYDIVNDRTKYYCNRHMYFIAYNMKYELYRLSSELDFNVQWLLGELIAWRLSGLSYITGKDENGEFQKEKPDNQDKLNELFAQVLTCDLKKIIENNNTDKVREQIISKIKEFEMPDGIDMDMSYDEMIDFLDKAIAKAV